MIKLEKLGNRLEAIVTQRSIAIVERRFNELKHIFLNTLRLWKIEVRMLLSVPHREGTENISKYPHMRTGDLRRSLYYRSKAVRKKVTPRAITMSVIVDWDNDPHGFGDENDYGETLNSGKKFRGRSFFGWKDRTYALLHKRLRDNIK